MNGGVLYIGSLFAVLAMLGGCGTSLPVMDFRNAEEQDFNRFVRNIALHVRCELRQAIATEYIGAIGNTSPGINNRLILKNWAAKIALTLRGVEKSTLNPTISAFNVPSTFIASVTTQLEANASREMTMTYYLPFSTLLRDTSDLGDLSNTECPRHSRGEPIAGNLGIHQTLAAAFETWDAFYPTSNGLKSGDPFDTITHHVTFQIQAQGGINPAWKFVNVNVNPSGVLLSAQRQQYDELLITMGPAIVDNKKLIASPSKQLDDSFFVERLRSAIRQPTN